MPKAANTYLVIWQQQVVEAGVGSGQPVAVGPSPADGEGRGQAGQALDGNPVTACHKEQQLLLLLRLQAVDHFPEPLDCLRHQTVHFPADALVKHVCPETATAKKTSNLATLASISNITPKE